VTVIGRYIGTAMTGRAIDIGFVHSWTVRSEHGRVARSHRRSSWLKPSLGLKPQQFGWSPFAGIRAVDLNKDGQEPEVRRRVPSGIPP